ncbi:MULTISPECIES: RNA polymerase sigma factor [Methylomonas]|uniref:RNA polymerase subunit sigma-24 n=1 Tax=Methylomonas koyamae TaxID=702114 RepID=A0A177N3A5_9GAMM|nr:RNA polymerase sigma factor [Methylomonas koyamae]OAI11670.1 RNA polymerase subunit sigma-24 [Methylomonas koyamae]
MTDTLDIQRLIVRYDAELRRVMFRRCGCWDMAADIVQETYQRMLSGDLWRAADNPRALMHRIAANLATDYERRDAVRDRYLAKSDELPDWVAETEARQPDRLLAARQRLGRLVAAVEGLPPKCRRVFEMRKFEELSQAEIAERLGISRNMVEKHLRNALLALQQVDDD